MFVDQATAFVTFSERIPVDQVAVTVSVDQVHGVAGLLVPGDKVNLMVVLDPQAAALAAAPGAPKAPAAEGANGGATVRYLYQNVEVLAIGQPAAADVGATEAARRTAGSGLITFNVPPDAAQRIALAGERPVHDIGAEDFQPVELPPVDCPTLPAWRALAHYPAGGDRGGDGLAVDSPSRPGERCPFRAARCRGGFQRGRRRESTRTLRPR